MRCVMNKTARYFQQKLPRHKDGFIKKKGLHKFHFKTSIKEQSMQTSVNKYLTNEQISK